MVISDPRHTECSNLTEARSRSLVCLLSTLWFIGTSNVEPYHSPLYILEKKLLKLLKLNVKYYYVTYLMVKSNSTQRLALKSTRIKDHREASIKRLENYKARLLK